VVAVDGADVPAIPVAVAELAPVTPELLMAPVMVLVGVTAPVDVTALLPVDVTALLTMPVPDGTATTPPAPSPAPLLITGVGDELIDAFTVDCGFAVIDGETNWPVTGVPACCEGPGEAGPRTTPW
jgi:hypothetical protein